MLSLFFFFKQKTAYEMRISDWSSDVCSSDLDKASGRGTLTAGNSTPLTDGAAACLLSSDEWAAAHGHEVLCHIRDAQTAAVDFVHGEGLLMAPTIAVPEMLKRNGLTLQDFDLYEIHEAFAAPVLCTLRAA